MATELFDLAVQPQLIGRGLARLQLDATGLVDGYRQRAAGATPLAQRTQQIQRGDPVAEIGRSRIGAVPLPDLSVALYQRVVPGH